MKLIKAGQDPSQKEYEFTCSNCGAIFICAFKECSHHFDQRDGDSIQYDCPTCGVAVWRQLRA